VDIDTITEFRPAPGAAWQPGDAWLAGGTWLFSQPQPELRRLLDLGGFGWAPLAECHGGLEIAATCTLGELARWRPAGPGVRWAAVPLLRQCCDALLASFKVQNVATVGGNICLALPAGAMTSLAAALDGVATLWSPGGGVREVPVTGFVTGPGTTLLGPGNCSARSPSRTRRCAAGPRSGRRHCRRWAGRPPWSSAARTVPGWSSRSRPPPPAGPAAVRGPAHSRPGRRGTGPGGADLA